MYIFAEPVTEEQITTIQTANDAKIQEFEQQILGTKGDGLDGEEEDQSWENLQANVQDAMDEDLRDPTHDESRQYLDPVLTSKKQDSARQHASSDDSSSIDPINRSTTAAAEDDEEVDDDSDEDVEVDEEDNDDEEEEEEEAQDDEEDEEEGGEEDDDDGNDEDSHEVVAEGMLVDNAVGRDTESYADARGDIEERLPQDGDIDGVKSPTNAENQGELDAGAKETEDRGEDEDTMKAESLEESDSTSSSEGANGSAIASDSKQEIPKTEAGMDGLDCDSGDNSQKTAAGDEFPTGADVPFIEGISQSSDATARPEGKEVLALTLTIRNKVNKSYVLRPENLGAEDQWTMEYSLDEVSNPDRAWSLYQACQLRRRKKLDDVNRRSENDDGVDVYIRRLREMSRKGAEWRKKQDEKDKALPVKVLGQPVCQNEDDQS